MPRPAVHPGSPEEPLRTRISNVYAAFAGYPLAERIHPDAAFPSACDDRPLRATPLRRLPAAAFQTYLWKAITTWGTADDFRHFLPRLLELVATAAGPGGGDVWWQVEPPTVFGKLRSGEWRRWPAAERRALDGYFAGLWGAVLARPVDLGDVWGRTRSAGDWLRAFASAHDDLAPFLAQWRADATDPASGLPAVAHLADTVVRLRDDLLGGDALDWDMYRELDAQERQVMGWLASDATLGLLEAAFFRWPDTPYAGMISDGHQLLAEWRQQRQART